ncbi:thiosulfate oxidation carrier protein SoxY [Paracandidimonas soli]|uniref:thiosulfate oxidation carrier protein SoxY n=1 Tax=Paracandidimonas soli TaxID=1917182 RepID=UPI0033417DA5
MKPLVMKRLRRLSALALVSAAVAVSFPAAAQWQRFAPAAELVQGKALQDKGLKLDLPSLSENGGAVPLGLVFDGVLDEGDALDAIHILATANPRPEIIAFRFLDESVVPDLSTRIRLSESQSVIAIAVSRSGKAWVVEQPVRVTVSGCLMPGEEQSEARMRNPRVAVSPRIAASRPVEIKSMIQHPMETGQREGADGATVPQNLIRSLEVSLAERPVLQTRFHSGTASNPYVRLNVRPGGAGAVRLVWTDQDGRQLSEERPFPA